MTTHRSTRLHRIEPLEDRKLLATTIRVAYPTDSGNQSVVGTLSWAIAAANFFEANGAIPASGPYSNQQAQVQGFDLITSAGGLAPFVISFDLINTISLGARGVFMTGSLPQINAREITIDGTLTGVAGQPSAFINGGSPSVTSVGLRYNGLASGAGRFEVRDIEINGFYAAPIQISSLGSDDAVEINNVLLVNNGLLSGTAGIEFRDTPSGTGYFRITNSTIQGNGGPGIWVHDTNQRNVVVSSGNVISGNTITNNGLHASGEAYLRSGVLLEDIRTISLLNNTVTTSIQSPAVSLSQVVTDVIISGNSLNSTNASPLILQARNTPRNNRYTITSNTFSTQATPP